MKERDKEELKDNWSTFLLAIAEVCIIIGAFAMLEVIGIKNVTIYGKVIIGFSFILGGIFLRQFFGSRKPSFKE